METLMHGGLVMKEPVRIDTERGGDLEAAEDVADQLLAQQVDVRLLEIRKGVVELELRHGSLERLRETRGQETLSSGVGTVPESSWCVDPQPIDLK